MDQTGVFRVPIEISSLDGSRHERFEALVDTGASYTTLPASILHRLGITPYGTIQLTLADGSAKEYELGHAMARLNGQSAPTVVVFGEDSMRVPILGAYTLEDLR